MRSFARSSRSISTTSKARACVFGGCLLRHPGDEAGKLFNEAAAFDQTRELLRPRDGLAEDRMHAENCTEIQGYVVAKP